MDSDVRITHGLVEYASKLAGEARATQVLVEVILRRAATARPEGAIGPLAWVEWPRRIADDIGTVATPFTAVPPDYVAPMVYAWLEWRRDVRELTSTPSALVPPAPEAVDPMTLAWLEWRRNTP